MRRSVYNSTLAKVALPAATRTASANGTAVAVRTHDSAMLVVVTGTITDGTHAVKFQESDDGSSGWTDVAAEHLQGDAVSVGASDDNAVFELGYVGNKAFVRPVVTVSGATSGGVYGVVVLLGAEPVTR